MACFSQGGMLLSMQRFRRIYCTPPSNMLRLYLTRAVSKITKRASNLRTRRMWCSRCLRGWNFIDHRAIRRPRYGTKPKGVRTRYPSGVPAQLIRTSSINEKSAVPSKRAHGSPPDIDLSHCDCMYAVHWPPSYGFRPGYRERKDRFHVIVKESRNSRLRRYDAPHPPRHAKRISHNGSPTQSIAVSSAFPKNLSRLFFRNRL